MRGPLAGLAGLYDGQPSEARLLILLSMLGSTRRMTVPVADVVAVRLAVRREPSDIAPARVVDGGGVAAGRLAADDAATHHSS